MLQLLNISVLLHPPNKESSLKPLKRNGAINNCTALYSVDYKDIEVRCSAFIIYNMLKKTLISPNLL